MENPNIYRKYVKFENKKKICLICNMEFQYKTERKYCSIKCRQKDPLYIQKLRDANLKHVVDGTHKGWKHRNNPSYPELFFMTVLKNNNIEYEFERPEGKYFIDFALHEKKIALEIDGKQHLQEKRKISDNLKDNYLKSIGWKVYRIPWKSINTENGKTYIKEKIYEFIKFYSMN
jgi:very-short-patch-repair endonuclease